MRGLVAAVVISASLAITWWIVRLSIRTSLELRSRDAGSHGGAEEMSKASFGGALVTTPLLIAAWLDAPPWLLISWLATATAGLGWLLIRERRQSGPPDLPRG